MRKFITALLIGLVSLPAMANITFNGRPYDSNSEYFWNDAKNDLRFEDEREHRELSKFEEQETKVGVFFGGWSKHLNGGDYNESHKMLGMRYNNVVFGRFKNSYSHTTTFLGYTSDDVNMGYDWVFNGWFGLTHGYTKEESGLVFGDTKLMPMASLQVRYTKYPIQPTFGTMGVNVLFFNMYYDF